MSAMPTSHTSAAARPALQLVEGGRARPRQHPLAPQTALQAWRRRVTVLLLVASLLVLAGIALAPDGAIDAAPVATSTTVVEPGQTVWDVARAHAPEGVGTGSYARSIIELNGLDGGSVDAWQVLLLPGA